MVFMMGITEETPRPARGASDARVPREQYAHWPRQVTGVGPRVVTVLVGFSRGSSQCGRLELEQTQYTARVG
jgi:hypothetical protein